MLASSRQPSDGGKQTWRNRFRRLRPRQDHNCLGATTTRLAARKTIWRLSPPFICRMGPDRCRPKRTFCARHHSVAGIAYARQTNYAGSGLTADVAHNSQRPTRCQCISISRTTGNNNMGYAKKNAQLGLIQAPGISHEKNSLPAWSCRKRQHHSN
jgi:hypothetical protein